MIYSWFSDKELEAWAIDWRDMQVDEATDYECEARAAGWHWALNFGSAPDGPRHPERNAWASDWRDAWEQEQLFRLPNKTPAQQTALKVWSAWDLVTRNQNQIHGAVGFSREEKAMIVRALLALADKPAVPMTADIAQIMREQHSHGWGWIEIAEAVVRELTRTPEPRGIL